MSVRVACAECGCVVEGGIRIETCRRPDCCCGHVPRAEDASPEKRTD